MSTKLFTLDEARTFDQKQLADAERYPDAMILEAHDRIAEEFAQICGVSFLPVEVTVRVDGNGSDLLTVPHLRVHAVDVVAVRRRDGWTEFSQDMLDDILILPGGLLRREFLGVWPRGTQNIRVTYRHGWETPPLAIRQAALRLLVSTAGGALASSLSERATSFSDETGTYRMATPGVGESYFGVPSVDSVLVRYSEKVPVVG